MLLHFFICPLQEGASIRTIVLLTISTIFMTAAQLKTIQEVITLVVFGAFSVLYLGERLKWNYLAGFACIIAAVFFVFHER